MLEKVQIKFLSSLPLSPAFLFHHKKGNRCYDYLVLLYLRFNYQRTRMSHRAWERRIIKLVTQEFRLPFVHNHVRYLQRLLNPEGKKVHVSKLSTNEIWKKNLLFIITFLLKDGSGKSSIWARCFLARFLFSISLLVFSSRNHLNKGIAKKDEAYICKEISYISKWNNAETRYYYKYDMTSEVQDKWMLPGKDSCIKWNFQDDLIPN